VRHGNAYRLEPHIFSLFGFIPIYIRGVQIQKEDHKWVFKQDDDDAHILWERDTLFGDWVQCKVKSLSKHNNLVSSQAYSIGYGLRPYVAAGAFLIIIHAFHFCLSDFAVGVFLGGIGGLIASCLGFI